MSEVRLAAEPRTEFGKGAARRVRRSGKVPAVLYGHGESPRHVSLPGHDLMIALRRDPNALLTLELASGAELALPRAVVRDPIKGFLEHVDLLLVRRGERVTVELAITVIGDTQPGTLVESQLQALSVDADATEVPNGFDISVEGRGAGWTLKAGDVALPAGVTLITDAEALVLSVVGSTADSDLAEADAEAEAHAIDDAAAEGDAEALAVTGGDADGGSES